MSLELADLSEAQKRVQQLLVELGFAESDERSRRELPSSDKELSQTPSVPISSSEVIDAPILDSDIGFDTLLVMKRPERVLLSERIREERNLIVHRKADISIDASDDLYPRSLEAEGFYVAPIPYVAASNVDVVAARLLREVAPKFLFFDEEGKPAFEPDPLERRALIAIDAVDQLNIRLLDTKIIRPARAISSRSWLGIRVELSSVKLRDHELFSAEDFMTAQLEEMFNEYAYRQLVDLESFYAKRIASLRATANDLGRKMRHEQSGAGIDAATRRELIQVLEKLVNSRKEKDLEEGERLRLLANMYDLWNELREWREVIGKTLVQRFEGDEDNKAYAGTRVRLYMRATPVNRDNDEAAWKRDEEVQVAELRDLHELRTREVQESAPFDVDAVRAKVAKQMRNHRRRPAQPIYSPVLDRTLAVLPDSECIGLEKSRRKRIRKTKVFLQLVLNGKVACRSKSAPLQFPGFHAQFQYSGELKVLSVPQSFACELWIDGALGAKKLAEIFIGVPHVDSAPAIAEYQFSSPQQIVSGENNVFAPAGVEHARHYCGTVTLSVAWQHAAGTNKLFDRDPREVLGDHRNARSHPSNLGRLLLLGSDGSSSDVEVDPNDPRNLEILELMRRGRLQKERGFVFRASQIQDELKLLNPAYYVESGRRKVLRIRQIDRLFDDPIPLLEDRIPERLFESVESTEGLPLDPLELSKRARQRLLRRHDAVATVSEVVREEQLPDFQFGMNLVEALFAPRRKLRPMRETRAAVGSPGACRLIVQVVRAQNLPLRRDPRRRRHRRRPKRAEYWQSDTDGVPNDRINDDAGDDDGDGALSSFVQMSFQANRRCTRPTSGADPTWNETLSVPLLPPNGNFAPPSLMAMRDELAFDLFDDFHVSGALDARQTNTVVRRRERRWLGRFAVPFATIYMNTSVEGHFRVSVPLANLGYEVPDANRATVVHLFVTLDPPLALPLAPDLGPEWSEHSRLFRYACNWLARLRRLPQCRRDRRVLKALAGDIHGAPAFLPHFIAPMTPPPSLGEDEYVRFVSQIPFVQDVHMGEQRDMWCSAAEFVELLGGDWEEHAVLLCNLLQYSEAQYRSGTFVWRSYVVLGAAVPDGDSAYVLRTKSLHGLVKETQIINAVSGDHYDASDELCPLVAVGTVFDGENLWANVQEHAAPSKISYQFDNARLWRPFFSARFPSTPLYTTGGDVYRHAPLFRSLPDDYYVQRAQSIERIVETHFSRWRELPTTFDHGISQILRDTLPSFEFVKQGRSEVVEERDVEKIRALYAGLYGFPLEFADAGQEEFVANTSSNPIVQAVYNTLVHENDDPKARFARAVYIYPYPNGVGAIWLYIAVCL